MRWFIRVEGSSQQLAALWLQGVYLHRKTQHPEEMLRLFDG